jgi:RHS repeat-associated protein
MKRSTVRHLFLLLLLAAAGSTDSFANHLPPVAVVNFYPERAPLISSNHGRMITGEEITFDGRSSYTTRSGTVITTYRWFVNGSQTQSGTSPVFTYTAGAPGTNVTIGLEVRDSYGTWSTRRNVIMEVAAIPRRYYYITDHLGSVRAVTNELGELVAYSDYYPFGLEMPKRSLAGDDATKEGFTGHELDAETGLNYAGARYYDPEIGRWLAVDPLAAKYPGHSPYNYVLNNPLRFIDPDGREVQVCSFHYMEEGESEPVSDCVTYTLGMEYDGDNRAIADAIAALDAIFAGGETGMELIGALVEDERIVRILPGRHSYDRDKGQIGFNTFDKRAGIDEEGGLETEPFVILAHELAHTYDHWHGVTKGREWFRLDGHRPILDRERFASYIENRVRDENGLAKRTHYALDVNNKGYPGSRVLNRRGTIRQYPRGFQWPHKN